MLLQNRTVVVIAGPTAVGKTEMALLIARSVGAPIISADSRQCYQELNIGVAKPTAAELQSVHHYFINNHSIHDKVDVAVFEQEALAAADKIFEEYPIAILVGGTGLYIHAFCHGMDAIPVIDSTIREEVRMSYLQNGIAWLQQAIAREDAAYYQKGEILNPQRMMRALEVVRATGLSILSFRNQKAVSRPFNIVKIGLELPRATLIKRINSRVDAMMENGLLQEVESLLPYKHLNALQTVGYKQLFQYLSGRVSKEEAVKNIKISTAQYAKRQMTWFKKDPQYQWFAADAAYPLLTHLEKPNAFVLD